MTGWKENICQPAKFMRLCVVETRTKKWSVQTTMDALGGNEKRCDEGYGRSTGKLCSISILGIGLEMACSGG